MRCVCTIYQAIRIVMIQTLQLRSCYMYVHHTQVKVTRDAFLRSYLLLVCEVTIDLFIIDGSGIAIDEIMDS